MMRPSTALTRSRFARTLLLLVLGLLWWTGCGVSRARVQAIAGTTLANGANVLLAELGEDFSDDMIASIRAAGLKSDADNGPLKLSPDELEARRRTAMRDAQAAVVKRWAPIWGEGESPGAPSPGTASPAGLWGDVRAAHDAWARRLEAGEPVVDEVLDPAVVSSVCKLALALPLHTSFHLPEGIVCP